MSQHHFDTYLAKVFSVDIAVMINNIDFWLHRNVTTGDGIYNNKVWSTFTAEDMQSYFIYWPVEKIRRLLREMAIKDILISDQFKGVKRVKSYTFSDTFLLNYKDHLNIYNYFQKETTIKDSTHFVELFNHVTSIKQIAVQDTRRHGSSQSSAESLNAYEFSFLKYFQYWNSKDNLTTHTLPKNVGDKCTKTIKRGINKLIKITKGEFFTAEKFGTNDSIIYPKPITEAELYMAIDHLSLATRPDYTPKTKNGIATNLPDFLFNSRLGNSNLLEFLSETPTKIYKLDKVPKNVKDKYLSLFGGNISESHKQRLDEKIEALYNVFMNNKYLNDFYNDYAKYMGTLSSFYETHYNYLKTYSDITIGHLNTYGKVWARFKAWLKDNHSLEIEIDDEKFKLMKKRRRQLLIQKGIKTVDDFDENDNLKEDNID
jgi:hypothetical protein